MDDVAGQHHVVGADKIVADLAIMRDVRADHEKTFVADGGDAAVARGAGAHGHVLADIAIGADHELGRLALVAERLRRSAE